MTKSYSGIILKKTIYILAPERKAEKEEDGMDAYRLGIIAGILFVVAAAAVCIRKQTCNGPCRYDERQERVRGRGYKYGFLTMIIYNALMGGMYLDTMPDWCDLFAVNIIGIAVSALIFAVYCIWNDAYMSFNESPRMVYLFILGIAAFNLFPGIMNLMHGTIVEEGKLTFRCSNIIMGFVFLISAAVFWLKNHLRAKGEE